MALVVSERAVVAGGAVFIGLMVAVMGWKSLTAPARPTPPATAVAVNMDAIQTISTGEEVDLAAHLPASGRTVVEFTADW